MSGDTEGQIAAAIDNAEDIADPLDGLAEKVATDAGAPFVPDVLERLCELKREDRAAFEILRARLKKAGCRVTALDDAIAEENGEAGGRGPSQADILIGLAADVGLLHAPNGTGYADLEINGHRETWPIRSKGFRRWLARRYFGATDGAPSSEALQSALNVIEARAHFDAPQADVRIRVAGYDGKLYLDLADDAWRAVEIDEAGWRIIDEPPVRFRRAAGMQPLPAPVTGGFVETLRSFLNVSSDNDFVLVVAWALAVLRDKGPYGRDTVEACRSIDVNRLHRAGCLAPGWWGGWEWKRDGERVASITMRAEEGRLVLSYKYRLHGDEWQSVEEPVPIVRVPCPFGGTRPYFICPGVVNGVACGRRVAKLYGPGKYFLCRHCYRLAYTSQSEGNWDRALRRANKVRTQLGGDPGMCSPFPKRPKGMWRKTYERLRCETLQAERVADQAFIMRAARLMGRLEGSNRRKDFWR